MCAVAAGVLRCLTAFSTSDDPSARVEVLYLAIDMLLVFSIAGLLVHLSPTVDVRSVAGFVGAIVGLCLIVGPDAPLGDVDLYPLGAALVAAGTAAFTWPARSSGLVPRWAAWAFVAALPVGSVGGGVEPLLVAAGLLFGFGMIGVGAAMAAPANLSVRAAAS